MGKIRKIQLRGDMDAYSRYLLDQVCCCLERAQRQLDAAESIPSSDYSNTSPEDERRMKAHLAIRVADFKIDDDEMLQACAKNTRWEFA